MQIKLNFIAMLKVFVVWATILPTMINAQDFRDSPFGFHPGNANKYQYIRDLGASWSREASYIVWDWVDVDRDGWRHRF